MNVEIGAEAAQFPETEYINGIALAMYNKLRHAAENSMLDAKTTRQIGYIFFHPYLLIFISYKYAASSNVKSTFFQDRNLSFSCFCSKKDRIYSFLKQNYGSKLNVFYQY
jgi:hypothetical protein